ncbi:hypothetical protein CALCODRAFT_498949 [Calocera cornea HHB12733]|uniref:F-box domain-containing protein n=1 Tax=Calocera cornea HHB12733 TaxID=1353952 RepID=A0A165EM01_9BASI|nr:hypothetical protein CALCODRAFT_498949 [Calocera cornea HHB12733]
MSRVRASVCRDMKEDVWLYIFETIMDKERRPSAIIPLMCVCKTWKNLAEPLLYQYLSFSSATAITRCHRSLMLKALRDQFPGARTRSLAFSHTCPDGPHPVIDRMLHYMPHLLVFHAPHTKLGTGTFEMLAQVCGPSLKDLEVQIGGDGAEGALQAALVSRFRVLRRLHICVSELGRNSAFFQFIGDQAWNLQHLEILLLRSPSKEALSAFFDFVSKGSFPSLTCLALDLPWLGPPDVGTTPAEALLSLFTKVGSQIARFTARIPHADNAPSLLFPLLTTVRTVRFPIGRPPQGFFEHLPASTEELLLGVDFSSDERTPALVGLLVELSLGEQRRKRLSLQLTSETTYRFEWWTLGVTHPNMAGDLMPLSVWLAAKNILLKDEAGKWIGQYEEEVSPA